MMLPDAPGVRVTPNALLRALNTFAVDATAPWLVEVDDAARLADVLASAPLRGTTPLVLGGGSNVLFVASPDVPVLRLTGRDVRIIDDAAGSALLYADAGMEWHALVMASLDLGLYGLENLALIPGTVGAAPIQNIGAYGVEVREHIEAVHVFECATGDALRLSTGECDFGYRDSLFKRVPGRYIVTGVEFRLSRNDAAPVLGYAGLVEELASAGVKAPRARDVANAVIAIRRRKLPDPAVLGNAGSFFKNPIVPTDIADALACMHPALPQFHAGDGLRKLPAAWLIDSLGFKGLREGDAGIAPSHALVLVNHGEATGRQLFDVAMRVARTVRDRYGVVLEPEPRLIGATWDIT